MKDWITVAAISLTLFGIGLFAYYAVDHWTALEPDRGVSMIAIAMFGTFPIASFAGHKVDKKIKGSRAK
ncbi:hypothetical protein [Corynebacterium sp. 13CS0277]|uniref:hypothetical protein n=1 Tax=Corynebacterium sp. 13CS0277 TaxID=2071994 RepID=UPI0011B25E2D|nr:hypothetical protein [Corynebacterium sp. 13CS0277]